LSLAAKNCFAVGTRRRPSGVAWTRGDWPAQQKGAAQDKRLQFIWGMLVAL
jgi:hypothetical protein